MCMWLRTSAVLQTEKDDADDDDSGNHEDDF